MMKTGAFKVTQTLDMSRVLLSILSIFLLEASILQSHGADSCTELYRQINRSISRGYVGKDAATEIRQIFEHPTLKSAEKAKRAFEVTVNERLKLLDPSDQETIRRIVNEGVKREYHVNVNASFDPFAKRGKPPILLSVPSEMRETVLEYALLAHELEHAIQHTIRMKGFFKTPKIIRYFGDIMNLSDRSFQKEVGAMLAEYEYLRYVPLKVRRQAISRIGYLTDEEWRVMENWAQKMDSLPGKYINGQHKEGRYSKQETSEMEKRLRSALREQGIAYTLLASPLILAGYVAYLEHEKNATK